VVAGSTQDSADTLSEPMKRTLLLITGIILSPLWLYLLYGFVLVLAGYEVTSDETALAEKLVQGGRPAKDCLLLRTIDLGPRPTTQELKASCIHRYAELTKDPTACELLMPSDYGWSCLGAAMKPNSRLCWFNFSPDPAEVGSGDMRVTLPECAQNPSALPGRCCELAGILYLDTEQNCNSVKDSPIVYDQCLELLARSQRNITLCTDISSDHIRSACEVAVKALQASSDNK